MTANSPDFPDDLQPDADGLVVYNPAEFPLPLSDEQAHTLAAIIEEHETASFHSVEVIFVDEKEIVRLNKSYLNRDYVTDIISFRYDDDPKNNAIEGSLYCCAPRIAEQASEQSVPVQAEFARIVIHGLLHLIGYDDEQPDQKNTMTELEDRYLKAAGL
ncbi:MAG: rRNA maturation RNase YbeY [Balneolaceae bacterium]